MLTLDEPDHGLRERFERGELTEGDQHIHPVLERWRRTRLLRLGGVEPAMRPGSDEVVAAEHMNSTAALAARADSVLESAYAELKRLGFVIILADRDGVIQASRGVEFLSDPELRAVLARGMNMSEAALGTNAVGTALAERTPIAVIGRAHYDRIVGPLCCYASPIRDANEQIVAALDISGPRDAADPLFGVLVQSLATTIEATLRLKQRHHGSTGTKDPQADALSGGARLLDLKVAAIVETLPIAIWVADAAGNIAISNEAARRLWGGERHVTLEQYDRYKAWWPDGRRLTSEEWGLSRALRLGEFTVDEEVRIETFDGLHKVIRNSAAPIVDYTGRIIGAVAVNEDITFLKRAEATRDLFMGILGHDLRSPLNAITLSAALLFKDTETAPAQVRTVARIQSSAARIQRLIDDLLDFTRARYGTGFPIARASVDMSEIAANVIDEVHAANPGMAVLFAHSGDLRGDWDPARVSQVVSNLVGNAVQHGKDPIRVEASDEGEVVALSVSNGGPPIAETKRSTLFEPFRKGVDSKGIGLGLFISKAIVRSHGGTIEVSSTDEGTVFTARWPRTARSS